MTMEMIYQIALALIAAGAVYGGIRADIKAMHQRIAGNEAAAQEAHRRMDRHIEYHAGMSKE